MGCDDELRPQRRPRRLRIRSCFGVRQHKAKEGDARNEDVEFVKALREIYNAVGDDGALHWKDKPEALELFLFPWRRHNNQRDAIADVFSLDADADAEIIASLVRSRAEIVSPAIRHELGTTGAKEHALAAVRMMRNAPSRSTFFGAKKGRGPKRAADRNAFREWLYQWTAEDLQEFIDLVKAPQPNGDDDHVTALDE